jgi:hypothetical protein
MKMEEAVTERIEKEKADSQWREFHEANEKKRREPTGQQKAYLSFLAKAAGVEVDVSKLKSRAEASRLIDSLKRRRSQKTGKSMNELRDRKVAFGMATKLVYRKFLDSHYTPGKSERFWKEVSDLFREYEKHQEAAISGFSNASEVAA